jgi:hypothetical protein
MVSLGKRGLVGLFVVSLLVPLLTTSSAAAAVGGTVTPVSHFNDPRDDWPPRAGAVVDVRYGPFTVPAATMDAPGMVMNQFAENLPAPCSNCFVTDIVPSLVYADGSDANFESGTMLHHFVLFNPAARDATCPNGFFGRFNFGDRIFASGSERSHLHLPDGYGYYNAGDRWTLDADLMNMMPDPQQVYVRIVVRYRDAGAHLKPLTPVWLDINNCGTSEYAIPHGESDADWSWTSNVTGDIVGIAGHQHDLSAMDMACMDAADCPGHGSGTAISAELVGGPRSVSFGPNPRTGAVPSDLTGSTICRSEDRYGTPFGMANGYMSHMDTMTACGIERGNLRRNAEYPPGGNYHGDGFSIRAGQTIRLHSQYTNPGAPRDDVMGIMVAYVHRTAVHGPAGR